MTVTESQQDLQTDVDVALVPERAPRMILEICRGLTRFPQRPICGPRFFIGSGPGCDLRLGGESRGQSRQQKSSFVLVNHVKELNL